ncbi:MAG: polysaccharide biosynthesis/export family protein [Phycisphaerae bacterium]
MRRRTLGLLSLLTVWLVLAAAGCAPSAKSPLQAFLQDRPKPVSGVPYRVLPPDVITVRSTYVPEIDGSTQQVRPDGIVNLPLVGEIDVVGENRTGLTPVEIEKRIAKEAETFYEQTDATVEVAGYNSQKVYVFGQVGRPGPQPWTGTNTVLDILANSQPNDMAWPEKIILVRGKTPRRGGYLIDVDDLKKAAEKAPEVGSEEAEDAPTVVAKAEKEAADPDAITPLPKQVEAKVLRVNLTKMYEKGDLSKNVYLQPDDMIYVPPTPLAEVGLALQQLLFPIRPAASAIQLPATAARYATGLP